MQEDQLAYFPYGNIRDNIGAVDVNYKYTGQEHDESTGLYFYNARYYDPVLGRFTQADTIVPGPRNPQNFNRYSYVGNNPINMIDPSGHTYHPAYQCPKTTSCSSTARGGNTPQPESDAPPGGPPGQPGTDEGQDGGDSGTGPQGGIPDQPCASCVAIDTAGANVRVDGFGVVCGGCGSNTSGGTLLGGGVFVIPSNNQFSTGGTPGGNIIIRVGINVNDETSLATQIKNSNILPGAGCDNCPLGVRTKLRTNRDGSGYLVIINDSGSNIKVGQTVAVTQEGNRLNSYSTPVPGSRGRTLGSGHNFPVAIPNNIPGVGEAFYLYTPVGIYGSDGKLNEPKPFGLPLSPENNGPYLFDNRPSAN